MGSSVCLIPQSKFGSFNQFSKTFNTDEFCYDDLKNTDFVFMRWKVLLVVLLTEICIVSFDVEYL